MIERSILTSSVPITKRYNKTYLFGSQFRPLWSLRMQEKLNDAIWDFVVKHISMLISCQLKYLTFFRVKNTIKETNGQNLFRVLVRLDVLLLKDEVNFFWQGFSPLNLYAKIGDIRIHLCKTLKQESVFDKSKCFTYRWLRKKCRNL